MNKHPVEMPWTLGRLLDETLPLNRKEKFFTGTVLPALVGADDLAHLGRLGDLVGASDLDVRVERDDCTVVFFTEYGIAESAVGQAKDRFTGLPTSKDTPDVVILVTRPRPVLIAIEAKMYSRPGGSALLKQLDAQGTLLAPLCERLAQWLGVPHVDLKHVALLPKAQADKLPTFSYPIITWEQLRAAFRDVAPHYWLAMLDEALDRFEDLVAKPIAYDEGSMTGSDVRDHYLAGDIPYLAMGRGGGGLAGDRLRADIDEGTWRETSYQVAAQQPHHNNWFAIADFIERLRVAGQLGEDAVADFATALESAGQVLTRVGGEGSVASQLLDDAAAGRLENADPARLRRVGRLFGLAAEAARVAREEASDLADQS